MACGGGTTPTTPPPEADPGPGAPGTPAAPEFLFAANAGSGTIASLRIQDDGSLAPVGGSPFASMETPRRLAFLTGARRLVAAGSSASADMRAYRVTAEGALEQEGAHQLGAQHEFMAAFPADNEVYVRLGTTGIGRFRYVNGDLQPLQTIETADPSGGTIFEMAADPQGRFVLAHLVFREGSQIRVYSRELQQVGLINIEPDRPGGFAVHPGGTHLFVIEGHNLVLYNLSGEGQIVATGASVATAAVPRDVLVHPDGSFVFVANETSGSVSMFAVAQNGTLTEVAGSPFAAGAGAHSLALDSSGAFLYVSNRHSGSVSGFRIADSALQPLPGSPYGTGGTEPLGIATGRP